MLKKALTNCKTIVLLLALTLWLSGCAWPHYIANLNVNIQGASYLNPDVNGRASPLVLTFYQLKSPYQFQQLSFEQLGANAGKNLGTDLIDKQSVEIRPDSNRKAQFALPEDAKYIGIVASYRNIDHSKWRQLVQIPKPGRTTYIWADCQSQAIKATINQSQFKIW